MCNKYDRWEFFNGHRTNWPDDEFHIHNYQYLYYAYARKNKTVNDDSCSMFLIIIINGAPSICVCFNHNVYVSLLEVIINESL